MASLQHQQVLHRPSQQLRPFQTTAKKAKVAVRSTSVLQETRIATGRLTVQYLQQEDIQGAGLLLARAFAGTPEAVKLDEAVKFMQKHVSTEGQELTLIAKLIPTDPSLLPPNKSSRLVGAVSLSFDSKDREVFASLAPPADEPYLANMAVDPKFRRQGIATAMLRACDTAAQSRNQPAIWLHVRQADDAAQKLYSSYGYSEVERDRPVMKGLLGFAGGNGNQRHKILMRKRLV